MFILLLYTMLSSYSSVLFPKAIIQNPLNEFEVEVHGLWEVFLHYFSPYDSFSLPKFSYHFWFHSWWLLATHCSHCVPLPVDCETHWEQVICLYSYTPAISTVLTCDRSSKTASWLNKCDLIGEQDSSPLYWSKIIQDRDQNLSFLCFSPQGREQF